MNKLNENFIVTLIDKGGDHLKAVADDGVHGTANCQFPREWKGISRLDFHNVGKQFEVRNLNWTGKFYRVTAADVIREVSNQQAAQQPAPQAQQPAPQTQPPVMQTNDKPEAEITDFDWSMFESLNEAADPELNRYEVYDENDKLLSVFEDEAEAIDYALANEGAYIDYSGEDTANFERVWTADEDEVEKCDWCGEYFDHSELADTDLGYLCDQCQAAIKSRGEHFTVYEGYDDDVANLLY